MKNNLALTTRSSIVEQKLLKIKECMLNYPEGSTPKMIAFDTSINVNTVKSLLPKIKGIKKILRGVYLVVERGDGPLAQPSNELYDWNFHNCILSCQLKDHAHKYHVKIYDYSIMRVKVVISKKGLVSCFVATDWPINTTALALAGGFLLEILKNHSSDFLDLNSLWIKTIEFNRDYSNLRLDGLQCITITNLIQQFKVYQKKRGMRVEHKTKVQIGVTDIIDLLVTNPNSSDIHVKLNDQMRGVERLTEQTNKNTQLLGSIINKMVRK